jgi:hypothetical protein
MHTPYKRKTPKHYKSHGKYNKKIQSKIKTDISNDSDVNKTFILDPIEEIELCDKIIKKFFLHSEKKKGNANSLFLY